MLYFPYKLHTWAQNLLDHPHIHFIVPGGGLNSKKTQWLHCKDGYFLPVQVLSKVFRAKVLELFEKAFHSCELQFQGQIEHLCHFGNFKDVLIKSAQKEWVVYSKEPFAGPEQVIKYLGQYTHRIAISNFRLKKLEGEEVHIKVRDRDNPGKSKIMVLHVKEFMRRFLLHALPKGYVRIRHFGILGSRLKKEKIAIVRRLKGVVHTVKETVHLSWKELLKSLKGIDVDLCPKCGSSKLLLGPPAFAFNSS